MVPPHHLPCAAKRMANRFDTLGILSALPDEGDVGEEDEDEQLRLALEASAREASAREERSSRTEEEEAELAAAISASLSMTTYDQQHSLLAEAQERRKQIAAHSGGASSSSFSTAPDAKDHPAPPHSAVPDVSDSPTNNDDPILFEPVDFSGEAPADPSFVAAAPPADEEVDAEEAENLFIDAGTSSARPAVEEEEDEEARMLRLAIAASLADSGHVGPAAIPFPATASSARTGKQPVQRAAEQGQDIYNEWTGGGSAGSSSTHGAYGAYGAYGNAESWPYASLRQQAEEEADARAAAALQEQYDREERERVRQAAAAEEDAKAAAALQAQFNEAFGAAGRLTMATRRRQNASRCSWLERS